MPIESPIANNNTLGLDDNSNSIIGDNDNSIDDTCNSVDDNSNSVISDNGISIDDSTENSSNPT